MKEQNRLLTIRWVSAATTAVLYVVLYFCTNFHYSLNDDVILLRSFAGCVGGVYERFNVFTHPLLAWPLHSLSVLFPSVAWFSVLQLALLAGAAYAALSAVQRAALRMGWSLPVGWLLAALNLLCFSMVFLTSITFTTTAALLGAAAVWQLLALNLQRPARRVIAGALGSFGWLVLGYLLREVSAVTNLSFWVGALLCRGLLNADTATERRARWKPLLLSLGAALLTLALLAGVRAADMRLSGQSAYADWFNASVAGIDYGGVRNADAAVLQSVGWTQSERELVLNWYFLDGNISAQAFEAFTPFANAPNLTAAAQSFRILLAKSRNVLYFLVLLGAGGFGALLCAALDRRRRLWAFLAPVGTGLAVCLELGYLALYGRLPMRAAAAVLLPGCALMLWLCLEGASRLRGTGGPRRAALIVLTVLFGFLACKCVLFSWSTVYNPVSQRGEAETNPYGNLETYALAHPEELLIAENAFGMDWRLFPDWRVGKADNVLYNWGGWNNHSEGYNAVFARYGLDAGVFSAEDWIGGPVRLVTPGDKPFGPLVAFLRERAGGGFEVEKEYAGDGFAVYRFSR